MNNNNNNIPINPNFQNPTPVSMKQAYRTASPFIPNNMIPCNPVIGLSYNQSFQNPQIPQRFSIFGMSSNTSFASSFTSTSSSPYSRWTSFSTSNYSAAKKRITDPFK